MNVTIEKGRLSIDLFDLLGELTTDQRASLIDLLACRDEVINEVTNQIIDGWTTEGSHGSTCFGGDPDAVYGIDGARMRIAKASGEIVAREIERLGEELKRSKARENEGWNKYHELLEGGRLA
jgi:hypothetical protein